MREPTREEQRTTRAPWGRRLAIGALGVGFWVLSAASSTEPGGAWEAPHGSWGERVQNPSSSPLALSPDGTILVAALAEHGAVAIVQTGADPVVDATPVCEQPGHVIVPNLTDAWVTCRREGTLVRLDLLSGTVAERLEVGTEPIGLTLDGRNLFVALSGDDKLARVDVSDAPAIVVETYALPFPNPRAVAIGQEGDVWVVHMARGEVSRVLTTASSVEPMHLRAYDRSLIDEVDAQHVSNVYSVTLSPSNDRLVVPHVVSSTAGLGEQAWTSAIRGGVSQIGLEARAQIDQRNATYGHPHLGIPQSGWLTNPTAVVVAEEPLGYFLVSQGTETLKLLFEPQEGARLAERELGKIGAGATALVIDPTVHFVYVLNPVDGNIIEFDLNVAAGLNSKTIPLLDAVDFDLGEGHRLFTSGADQRMSAVGSVACASCHPEGRSDGLIWMTEDGPRNTPPLVGGIMDTAPFHWPGDLEDLEALTAQTVQSVMGGSGLGGEGHAQLAAYINSLPTPPVPADRVDDEEELEAVARGQAIFESEEAGCASCHVGGHGTDGLNHDVGTGRAVPGDRLRVVATPVLHGLVRSSPYMHDGSIATLEEMVEMYVATDLMGVGSHLDPDDKADLVGYLKTR